MRNSLWATYPLLILVAIVSATVLLVEPVMALNVEKIGRGVAGNDREKMIMLKNIAFYAGLFFAVLGAIVTVFMKSSFALQKRYETHPAMGPFLIVFGLILMSVKLF